MKQILLSILMLVCVISVKAQDAMVATLQPGEQSRAFVKSVDDLQYRLDNPVQTRTEEPEIVDLSKYKALERDRPLYVRNGKSYQFINGTLKRTAALKDSAMLVISANSYVELGEGAILSGGGQQTDHELVLLETGSFKLSSGEINDCYNPLINPSVKYDNAVLVKTLNSSFEMTGGKIANTAGVVSLGGPMTFTGGNIAEGSIQSNTDFLLDGSFSVSAISLNGKAKIRITSELKNTINIKPSPLSELKLTPAQPDNIGDYEGVVVAIGENYTLTENDVKKIKSSRLSSDKWKFVLENNQIVIRRAGGIVDAATLQAYLDNAPAGSKEQPIRVEIPAEGIELECFIRVPDNKHFLITGGSITVKDLRGGDFAFNATDGASLTFDNIVLDGGNYNKGNSFFMVRGALKVNSTVTFRNTSGYLFFYYVFKSGSADVYGGDISNVKHGVWNEGTFNFYGGSFAGCEYGIYNCKDSRLTITDGVLNESCSHCIYSYADFRTKGNHGTAKISIAKGVRIIMTSEMSNGWVVGFINDDFSTDVPVIAGEGYALKSEDVNKVRFVLPQGYEGYLSAASGCIQVRATDQAAVRTEEALKQAIANATGTCSGEPTVIKIDGEIPISTIYIQDKAVKLTGGSLKRASGYTDGLFMLNNACLTLEDIVIDGNKAAYTDNRMIIWPPFSLTNQAKLTINKGTDIRNHRVYNSHLGLISIDISNKVACTVLMNGGSIHDNEVPAAELITDIDFKLLSLDMRGGSIVGNTTGYGVANVNTFTMSGGTIEGNASNYSHNISTQTGVIKSGGIIKEGKGIRVYSDLKIEGDGTNIADSIILNDPAARISRNGAQKSELVLNHSAFHASKLVAGTVVVAGYDGYQLTADDLNKYRYKNSAWQLELSGNTIVLKENAGQSFENGDDLQDFLDGLGQSGNTGTEKDPIDIVFTGEPIRLTQPLLVPEGTHVLFNGGSFIRGDALKSTVPSEAMLDIPASASLTLVNTTLDGGKKEAEDALISIGGQLKIREGSVIKGGLNKNGTVGSAVHVASTGVLTMSGGAITDNAGKQGSAVFNEGTFVLSGGSIYGNTSEIGNIVNYEHSIFTMTGGIVRDNKVTQGCGGIYIAENCQATFSAGEIRANEHSDVYSWSDVKYGGNTHVSGLFLAVKPAKVLISSALQYSLKLGHIAETVNAGAIVAQGTGGYNLTNQDLAKISCPDEKWMYVLKDGAILLAEKGSTSIENIQSSGNVYVENGSLVLAGQKIGEPYFIYSISGHLVHMGKITSDRHTCFLKETGIFIVKCGKGSYKVANFHKN